VFGLGRKRRRRLKRGEEEEKEIKKGCRWKLEAEEGRRERPLLRRGPHSLYILKRVDQEQKKKSNTAEDTSHEHFPTDSLGFTWQQVDKNHGASAGHNSSAKYRKKMDAGTWTP